MEKEEAMEARIASIKDAVIDVLGGSASQIFLSRMDKTLDEAGGDPAAIRTACVRIEKMVRLFIGPDEARAVGERCRLILG